MPRPVRITPITEETSPGFNPPAAPRSPLIWAIVWVMRAAICAQLLTSYLLGKRVHGPDIKPVVFHQNRQLRRARASCLRRARRCARKHGRLNPADYTPRAYAHFAYVDAMPKHVSVGQFMERYVRDTGLSRAQVYGLSAAHRITGFDAADICTKLFAALTSRLSLMGSSALGFEALSDPAPP